MDTRCLIATDQDRAAVRSLLDKPLANADGSYDLYFSPEAPAFDGTRMLHDIAEVR